MVLNTWIIISYCPWTELSNRPLSVAVNSPTVGAVSMNWQWTQVMSITVLSCSLYILVIPWWSLTVCRRYDTFSPRFHRRSMFTVSICALFSASWIKLTFHLVTLYYIIKMVSFEHICVITTIITVWSAEIYGRMACSLGTIFLAQCYNIECRRSEWMQPRHYSAYQERQDWTCFSAAVTSDSFLGKYSHWNDVGLFCRVRCF